MEFVLLDSDIIIWYLRGKKDITAKIDNLIGRQDVLLFCSVLSYFEVKRGARKNEVSLIENFFEALSPLPVTQEIAEEGARLYQKYPLVQIKNSDIDLLIAATAIVHTMILFTGNTKHFDFFGIPLME